VTGLMAAKAEAANNAAEKTVRMVWVDMRLV
jgi:hypothetical protein